MRQTHSCINKCHASGHCMLVTALTALNMQAMVILYCVVMQAFRIMRCLKFPNPNDYQPGLFLNTSIFELSLFKKKRLIAGWFAGFSWSQFPARWMMLNLCIYRMLNIHIHSVHKNPHSFIHSRGFYQRALIHPHWPFILAFCCLSVLSFCLGFCHPFNETLLNQISLSKQVCTPYTTNGLNAWYLGIRSVPHM